jgi:hypothetical protein
VIGGCFGSSLESQRLIGRSRNSNREIACAHSLADEQRRGSPTLIDTLRALKGCERSGHEGVGKEWGET